LDFGADEIRRRPFFRLLFAFSRDSRTSFACASFARDARAKAKKGDAPGRCVVGETSSFLLFFFLFSSSFVLFFRLLVFFLFLRQRKKEKKRKREEDKKEEERGEKKDSRPSCDATNRSFRSFLFRREKNDDRLSSFFFFFVSYEKKRKGEEDVAALFEKTFRPDVRPRSLLSASHSVSLSSVRFLFLLEEKKTNEREKKHGFVVVLSRLRARKRRTELWSVYLEYIRVFKAGVVSKTSPLHTSAWDNGTRLEVSFRRFFSSRDVLRFRRVVFHLSRRTRTRKKGKRRARETGSSND
jgi:hypothetical protein